MKIKQMLFIILELCLFYNEVLFFILIMEYNLFEVSISPTYVQVRFYVTYCITYSRNGGPAPLMATVTLFSRLPVVSGYCWRITSISSKLKRKKITGEMS